MNKLLICALILFPFLYSCSSSSVEPEIGRSDGKFKNEENFINACKESYLLAARGLDKTLSNESDLVLTPELKSFLKEHMGSVNSLIDTLLQRSSVRVKIVPSLSKYIGDIDSNYPDDLEGRLFVLGNTLLVEHIDDSLFLHMYSDEAKKKWDVSESDVSDLDDLERKTGECLIAHEWWHFKDVKSLGIDEFAERVCTSSINNPYRYEFKASEILKQEKVYDVEKRATIFQEYCHFKRGVPSLPFNIEENQKDLPKLLEIIKN